MPDGEIRNAQGEQIAFATIVIVAHAASENTPERRFPHKRKNPGNRPFSQVRCPYSTKIVRGLFKDTTFRTSTRASLKRLQRGLLIRFARG